MITQHAPTAATLRALAAVRRHLRGVPHHQLAALADELADLERDGVAMVNLEEALLERAAEDIRERLERSVEPREETA